MGERTGIGRVSGRHFTARREPRPPSVFAAPPPGLGARTIYIELDSETDTMPTAPPKRPMPGRVLWLYALATLEREGTVYGYALSDRVAERTDGAWRPGAGAVYPALQSLVRRGAARTRKQGVRRVYSITPHGRAILRRIRTQMAGPGPGAPDLSLLWAEIAGAPDPGAHMLRRLHRQLEMLDAMLARQPDARAGGRPLRAAAFDELSTALQRLGSNPVPRGPSHSAARGDRRR